MARYEPKTIATDDSAANYLATLDESQQRDSYTLIEMMQQVSSEPPVLWGKIIGFGKLHYKTGSGIEADWPIISFAPRKGKLSLYVTFDAATLKHQLDKIGPHEIGKGCIYFKNLDQANLVELKKLITQAYRKEGA